MTLKEKESLLNSFLEEFKSYTTDWYKIVETNQFPDKYSDEEMRILKIKSFGKAIAYFRKNYPTGPKTLREFAGIISYSHAYIEKIEKGKIKNLPVDKLECIADKFASSVSYLIGLTDDATYVPSRIDTYFWENPNSEYKDIEADIRKALPNEKGLNHMAQIIPGLTLYELKDEIRKLIGADYELADALYTLLSAPKKKRNNVIEFFKCLKSIYLT